MLSSRTTERFNWPVGFLLLVICCFLLMTPASQVTKKTAMDASVQITTMTLAVTGISNPISSLKNFLDHERTPLRSVNKRSHAHAPDQDNGTDSSAVMPPVLEMPPSFLCGEVHFTDVLLSLFTLDRLSWYALAPPTSRNS